MKIISEAIAAKEAQKKHDPWNLPLPVWQILTRTQQRLWINMRDMARKGGIPDDTITQVSRGGDEQPHEKITQPEKNLPTQVCRRTNLATTRDNWSDNPRSYNLVSDTASTSAEQLAFEEENLNDEQRRWLARVRMCNFLKTGILYKLDVKYGLELSHE